LGVALKMANTEEFRDYQKQVLKNCQALVKKFKENDYEILSGGSDNHLMLINMKTKKLDGSRAEKILDSVKIAVNKNTIPTDTSPFNPSGVRLGTPAITSRGFKEKDCDQVFEFIDKAMAIATKIKKETKTIKEFSEFVDQHKNEFGLKELRNEIVQFSSKFPTIGFEEKEMKYK
jgi:glycine hydroxymethyltransferase